MLQNLPVSRGTLFAWRKSGKIPHIRLKGRVLYHLPSVREALLRLQKGGGQ